MYRLAPAAARAQGIGDAIVVTRVFLCLFARLGLVSHAMAAESSNVPMAMTVPEARVTADRVNDVERVFAEGMQSIPPEIVDTCLVRDAKDPLLFRLTTIWRSMDDLQARRRSGVKPKGILMFEAVGATPALSIWEVVVHGGAQRP